MAYKKTAHKRRRARSSRRKNVKSRKVMRGGDEGADIRACNAKGSPNAPSSSDKDYIIKVARGANIIPDSLMCSNLVRGNYQWKKPYVRKLPSSPSPGSTPSF